MPGNIGALVGPGNKPCYRQGADGKWRLAMGAPGTPCNCVICNCTGLTSQILVVTLTNAVMSGGCQSVPLSSRFYTGGGNLSGVWGPIPFVGFNWVLFTGNPLSSSTWDSSSCVSGGLFLPRLAIQAACLPPDGSNPLGLSNVNVFACDSGDNPVVTLFRGRPGAACGGIIQNSGDPGAGFQPGLLPHDDGNMCTATVVNVGP